MADVKSQLKELTQFISPDFQIEIKGTALEYIKGLTATSDGCELIISTQNLPQSLVKLLIEDGSEEIRRDCLKILTNLVGNPARGDSIGLLDEDFLYVLMKYVLNKDSKYADDAARLMSNLTRCEENCQKVLAYLEKLKSISLPDFVDAFCISGYNKKNNQLSHLGSFLSNMTLIERARKLFLSKDRCVIQRLLPYTTHMESSIRRSAAIRIIKNTSFETEYHEWLLGPDVDILPNLLLPLAGPEELPEDEMDQLPLDLQYLPEDKKREPDEAIKLMLTETLLQFCTRRVGREKLKDSGTYIVMRELHQVEKNDDVITALEKLIQILIGDEPDENMEDLKNVEIPTDIQKKFEEADAREIEEKSAAI